MYLTRWMLDGRKRDTMRAMQNLNLFHGAVERSFPGERMQNLWRIDQLHGQPCLLVLSEQIPEVAGIAVQFGFPDTVGETLSYETLLNRITVGSRWHFRLVANPTIRKNGKVMAHITPRHQKNWLLTRAERLGFALTEEEFLVTGSRWYRFNKKKEDVNTVSLLAVTFEGTLTVLDAERFKQTLCEGIGREKAYGMGLLTIVRG